MATNSKLIGITFNEVRLQGQVVGDPDISQGDAGKMAAISLLTIIRVPDANGQWIDVEQEVPVIVTDAKRVEKLIEPYVKDRRQLFVKGYIQTWDGGWGVVAQDVQLGNPNTQK